MTRLEPLPDTPDWFGRARDRNACTNCMGGGCYCKFRIFLWHETCCPRCSHSLETEPDVQLGEN